MKLKKIIFISLIVFLILTIIVGGVIFMNEKKEIDFYKNQPLNLPTEFTYTAHTGCCGTEDNSLLKP